MHSYGHGYEPSGSANAGGFHYWLATAFLLRSPVLCGLNGDSLKTVE